MSQVNNQNAEGLQPELFVSGFFGDRFLKGERPNYGYPKNHLPECTIASMEVQTGYIVALNSQK